MIPLLPIFISINIQHMEMKFLSTTVQLAIELLALSPILIG